ncbi:hypothetical protein CF327_g7443 [Tilletia walkeri]|uniref:Uncharacterized protein n=1 Tax=Tilletia walkeri TaxID=117179 RepID=A0A8X7N3U9_9BASI|nr:hypothetical protein CF327_g7443 [Tilletia walkeri]KAE8265527.1 hypothetical protein A4X09_0g6616 [Tilletia walkeri]
MKDNDYQADDNGNNQDVEEMLLELVKENATDDRDGDTDVDDMFMQLLDEMANNDHDGDLWMGVDCELEEATEWQLRISFPSSLFT